MEQITLQKNQLVEVEVTDLSDTGEGIGRVAGVPLFIKNAVVGDTVEARILKMKKTYGFAKVERMLKESPDRVEPFCPHAAPCGGCQLQALSYEKQLAWKREKVAACFRRIGGLETEVLPVLGMAHPRAYRNKAQFPVGRAKDGSIVIGFYASHSHRIVPTECCPIEWDGHEEILAAVRAYLEEEGIPPYDEETHRGLVRHILLRYARATGEWMVCLIINGTKLPRAERLLAKLTEIPGMASIVCNHNETQTNVILGDTVETLWGRGFLYDCIGDVRYRISPLSFYQVNPEQTKVLYDTALSFAGLTGKETVWDLYCGIGTISLFLARKAKQVYGVEIVPQAIEDARQNAADNGISNAQFFCGSAEDVLAEHPYPADVIVVDPPRKGCDERLLATMLALAPARIVYVSCDPATLARDAKVLCASGYTIVRVQPVDMFAQTVGVECVVLLSKVEK